MKSCKNTTELVNRRTKLIFGFKFSLIIVKEEAVQRSLATRNMTVMSGCAGRGNDSTLSKLSIQQRRRYNVDPTVWILQCRFNSVEPPATLGTKRSSLLHVEGAQRRHSARERERERALSLVH